ncbi:MAG: type II secretion system protein GspL [Desulfobacteraceae bacterium]|jgi:general secretion pathway protein L
MSRQILAIDIRPESIEAVLLNTGLKVSTITDCTTVPFAATSESGDPLVEALSKLKDQIDAGTASVVVAMPPEGVHYRKLSVPFKEDAKIRQVLPFELEPLLPIPIDHLKVDFHKNRTAQQTEILAVAVDQTVLQRYMDALSEAALRPQLIVPGSFPLASYLSGLEEFTNEQLLILDVGREKTTLFALESGNIELVRRLASGVDSEQAVESLALRIRQTLTAISDQHTEFFSPAKVYVTGEALEAPEAFQRISLALELPTEQIDLSQWAARFEMNNGVPWTALRMNNALAMALLEIDGRPCANFHRISSPLRNYWNAYRPYIMGPAVLLAVVLIIGLSGVMIDSYLLNKRVKNLDAQMREIYLSEFPQSRAKGNPIDLFESKIKELQKGGTSGSVHPTQVRAIDALLQISQLITPDIDVLLTRMSMGADSLTLSGETAAFNTVDDIKNRLEKGDLFKQVTIASANMDKSGKKVRFKIKIDL